MTPIQESSELDVNEFKHRISRLINCDSTTTLAANIT